MEAKSKNPTRGYIEHGCANPRVLMLLHCAPVHRARLEGETVRKRAWTQMQSDLKRKKHGTRPLLHVHVRHEGVRGFGGTHGIRSEAVRQVLERCVGRGCRFDFSPFACALSGSPFLLGAELEHLE
jgi:hypothetical protein